MQKHLFIKNKQGLNLATVVEIPESKGKFPCVLLFHGFKGYKEQEMYTDLSTRLLKENIASLRFDASGFGESDGTLEKDYRFSNYVSDTESVYDWIKQQNKFDLDKIGVCGQSMGGAQTILFTSRHLEIKVACAISPPDRIGTKDELGRSAKLWKKHGFFEFVSSKFGKITVHYAYLEDAQKYNFVDLTKNIKCPLLIVLGKKYTTVLPEQTKSIYEVANEPRKLIEFEEMDHLYTRNPKVLGEVNEKVVEFLVKYLKNH